jgi:hypothetical protein
MIADPIAVQVVWPKDLSYFHATVARILVDWFGEEMLKDGNPKESIAKQAGKRTKARGHAVRTAGQATAVRRGTDRKKRAPTHTKGSSRRAS